MLAGQFQARPAIITLLNFNSGLRAPLAREKALGPRLLKFNKLRGLFFDIPPNAHLFFWGFLRISTGKLACLYSGDSNSFNCASLALTSSFDTRTGSSSLLLHPVCMERHDTCGEGQTYGQWTEESARRIL